jgi:gamma-carbonic anhydrase
MPVVDHRPQLHPGAWVAPTASVMGDVELGKSASVWYGAVVRGDVGAVSIGDRSNVQDDAVIGGTGKTSIGSDVTVGHGALIASSHIGDRCLIGMKVRTV